MKKKKIVLKKKKRGLYKTVAINISFLKASTIMENMNQSNSE